MGRIRLLSDALASQVAAGEVVERPASVVKELIENSLDARARSIEVHVNRGGASLIRIVDDGMGMDRSDALLSIERHATSKLSTKDDLDRIATFGFRGEAVPSIASVSKFRLVTRRPEDISGTEIIIHGGKLISVKDWGGAPGTQIEVRSLFSNVPARRKFLRTENTEYSHVEQQVRVHAIAGPDVAFRLFRNDQPVFHLPPAADLRERIAGLAGRDVADRLLEVPPLQGDWPVKVTGFIGGPGMFRSDRTLQQIFLNGRPVEGAILHYGLREGYHTALMKGQSPIVFLFLQMDPAEVDVNVHPAKKEVRFRDGIGVRRTLAAAVAAALETASMASPLAGSSRPRPDRPFSSAATVDGPAASVAEQLGQSAAPSAAEPIDAELIPLAEQQVIRKDWMATLPTAPTKPETASAPPEVADSTAPNPAESTPPASDPDDRFRIIGVVGKLYVLMESDEGLVLMDQHAAHERVLFEQMKRRMEEEGVPSQRLLVPLTWEVAPRDYDLLKLHLPTLGRLGVSAEDFGPNTFKIDALPTFWRKDDPLGLLASVLEELRSAGDATSTMRLGEDMVATTVCRHAVKANDPLHREELEELVVDLLKCEMPYCCPHGRPTLIQMSFDELEKKFGRKV